MPAPPNCKQPRLNLDSDATAAKDSLAERLAEQEDGPSMPSPNVRPLQWRSAGGGRHGFYWGECCHGKEDVHASLVVYML
jgi:hypothetical protein